MTQQTRIFIDGGDPKETAAADTLLRKYGFPGVEGQTTNPTLIAKNAQKELQEKNGKAGKLSEKEALAYYRRMVKEMAEVTSGPISIQVIADKTTTAEDMLSQARERVTWIPNGVIKFPCTTEGLRATEIFCREGPVNITLTFSQEQAAAVYQATKGHNYEVFVSPFVGRLDDIGQNGMDVVVNTLEMYRKFGDTHVQVLTASVRTLNHILFALVLGSDVVTIPYKLLLEWAEKGMNIPGKDFLYDVPGLTELPYKELTLDLDWTSYSIGHDLTDKGVAKFWEDWKGIVE